MAFSETSLTRDSKKDVKPSPPDAQEQPQSQQLLTGKLNLPRITPEFAIIIEEEKTLKKARAITRAFSYFYG
jgi:hypothetical protein